MAGYVDDEDFVPVALRFVNCWCWEKWQEFHRGIYLLQRTCLDSFNRSLYFVYRTPDLCSERKPSLAEAKLSSVPSPRFFGRSNGSRISLDGELSTAFACRIHPFVGFALIQYLGLYDDAIVKFFGSNMFMNLNCTIILYCGLSDPYVLWLARLCVCRSLRLSLRFMIFPILGPWVRGSVGSVGWVSLSLLFFDMSEQLWTWAYRLLGRPPLSFQYLLIARHSSLPYQKMASRYGLSQCSNLPLPDIVLSHTSRLMFCLDA